MKFFLDATSQDGFTIIETLFVLATAAIIILIVFLAIPTVDRSSRNNERRQDVNLILQSVLRYELRNTDNLPACGYGSTNPTVNCVTGTATDQIGNLNLSYYTSTLTPSFSSVSVITNSQSSIAGISNPTGINNVVVRNYAKCTGGDATGYGAGYSDVVAFFSVETGGSPVTQCQQL